MGTTIQHQGTIAETSPPMLIEQNQNVPKYLAKSLINHLIN
jgi:hypothetical protein